MDIKTRKENASDNSDFTGGQFGSLKESGS